MQTQILVQTFERDVHCVDLCAFTNTPTDVFPVRVCGFLAKDVGEILLARYWSHWYISICSTLMRAVSAHCSMTSTLSAGLSRESFTGRWASPGTAALHQSGGRRLCEGSFVILICFVLAGEICE